MQTKELYIPLYIVFTNPTCFRLLCMYLVFIYNNVLFLNHVCRHFILIIFLSTVFINVA